MDIWSVIEFLLSGVCHQIPEHSLHYAGRVLPLCARCTGTFLGMGLALLLLAALRQARRTRIPPWPHSALLAGLVGFWALDGGNSFASLLLGRAPFYAPSNALRLASGMGNGLALGTVLWVVWQRVAWRQPSERRVLARPLDLLVLLAAGALLVLTLLAWESAPHVLWAGLGAATVLLALAAVNGALILLLTRKEGTAEHGSHLLPYLLAGALAALTEMSALALLRRLLIG